MASHTSVKVGKEMLLCIHVVYKVSRLFRMNAENRLFVKDAQERSRCYLVGWLVKFEPKSLVVIYFFFFKLDCC